MHIVSVDLEPHRTPQRTAVARLVTTVGSVPSVSAMFPCYNDASTIGRLVDDVHQALAPLVADLEVIVVNDGSSDNSRDVLDRLANVTAPDPDRTGPLASRPFSNMSFIR